MSRYRPEPVSLGSINGAARDQRSARGRLRMIRDQTLRIARCQFTFQWEGRTDGQGNRRRSLVDVKIAIRLDEWLHRGGGDGGDIVVELHGGLLRPS